MKCLKPFLILFVLQIISQNNFAQSASDSIIQRFKELDNEIREYTISNDAKETFDYLDKNKLVDSVLKKRYKEFEGFKDSLQSILLEMSYLDTSYLDLDISFSYIKTNNKSQYIYTNIIHFFNVFNSLVENVSDKKRIRKERVDFIKDHPTHNLFLKKNFHQMSVISSRVFLTIYLSNLVGHMESVLMSRFVKSKAKKVTLKDSLQLP
jgi:hypothetical protein